MKNLEIRDYFIIIYKRLWIIVVTAALLTAASGAYSTYVRHKVYSAQSKLYIGKQTNVNGAIEQGDLSLGDNLVKDYSELIRTNLVTEAVKEKVIKDVPGMKAISGGYIASEISVSLVNNSRFIQIYAEDTDPKLAALIVNEVAEVFKEKAMELMKIENISIIDKAQIPSAPIKPQPLMDSIIGFFAGVMAGMLIIFLLEYLDDTIKTPDDIQKNLQLDIVGIIPKIKQSKLKPMVEI